MQNQSELRVSVALCTHNGSRYVEEQVRSILAQTRLPDEVIVSDDDSADDTVERVRAEFSRRAENDVSLRVIVNTPALGVTRNFEQAIVESTGELIVLCDQDDVWHPERIERMLDRFVRKPELDLMYSDARLVGGDGQPLGESLFTAIGVTDEDKSEVAAGRALSVLLRRNIVTGATVMFRRRLLVRALPFPLEWVHDEWLAIVAALVGRVDLIDAELLDYRQHGANQIGAASLTLAGKIRKVLEPRTERNAQVAARAEILQSRLALIDSDAAPSTKYAVAMKVEHERVRSSLPQSRWRRLLPVLGEVRTGRYHRFGRGVPDIVRDLIQPV